eukprot:6207401-Pleurochrysis_carterae.AAC.3
MPKLSFAINTNLLRLTLPRPSLPHSLRLPRRQRPRPLGPPLVRRRPALRQRRLHQLLIQPVISGLQSAIPVRNLTADERDHFVISTEQLASVHCQIMESILGTITSPAT